MARDRRRRRRGQKPGVLRWILIGAIVFFTFPFLWGTWAIIFVLGLPMFAAWMVDRGERRHLLRSVVAVNIVGMLPALSDLWLSQNFYEPLVVVDILKNVWYYLIAYGISAIGWGLYKYVPRFIGEHMAHQARKRVVRLRSRQGDLVSEWGEKVKAGVPNEDADDAEMIDAALGGAEPMGLESSVNADLPDREQPGDHISEGLAQQRAV